MTLSMSGSAIALRQRGVLNSVSLTDPLTLGALDTPRGVWNQLALTTPAPDPFSASTHWQLAFRSARSPSLPVLVKATDEGLVQFGLRRTSSTPGRILGPIERLWEFGANLLGPAAPDMLAEIVADLIGVEGRLSMPLVFSGLDPAGARLGELHARFGEHYCLRRRRSGVQCAASLEGGLDGFLSRRSANFRRNMRRQVRRADSAGITFERMIPQTPEAADAAFTRMFAVELVSWKGIDQCGMEDPDTSRFYRTLLRQLARSGDARVIFAAQDGLDAGYIFGGILGDFYRGQQFSFEERFSHLSIGNLLQFEQIRWLCEEGARRYDMGPLNGCRMAYKRHWTEIELPIESWVML